jgi:hypothetical protein
VKAYKLWQTKLEKIIKLLCPVNDFLFLTELTICYFGVVVSTDEATTWDSISACNKGDATT